jgi:hypothetical protein
MAVNVYNAQSYFLFEAILQASQSLIKYTNSFSVFFMLTGISFQCSLFQCLNCLVYSFNFCFFCFCISNRNNNGFLFAWS